MKARHLSAPAELWYHYQLGLQLHLFYNRQTKSNIRTAKTDALTDSTVVIARSRMTFVLEPRRGGQMMMIVRLIDPADLMEPRLTSNERTARACVMFFPLEVTIGEVMQTLQEILANYNFLGGIMSLLFNLETGKTDTAWISSSRQEIPVKTDLEHVWKLSKFALNVIFWNNVCYISF